MEDPEMFTDEDRKAVLEVLAAEVRAKAEGRPYSQGVITACEVCLRVNARKPSAEPPYYTMPSEGLAEAKTWGDEITILDPDLRETARQIGEANSRALGKVPRNKLYDYTQTQNVSRIAHMQNARRFWWEDKD